MNEDRTQSVANTETQTNGDLEQTKTRDKSEQQNVANSKNVANQEQNQNLPGQNVKENTVDETPQEKPADAAQPTTLPIKNNQQSTSANNPADKPKASDQEKPVVDNHTTTTDTTTTDTTTAEPPKKLSDVVPSTIVWLSGMVGKKQFDCAGPFSVPFKLDKPTWPYVTVAPNPKYTNQVFDYDADGGAGKWVPTDAKSQGQLLTDLAKQVTTLKDDSQKHDQSADQSQKMGMQLTKVMLQLSSKVDALNTKIDGIVNNEKDGDK